MKAEIEEFRNLISEYSRDELFCLAVSQQEELLDRRRKDAANARINTDAHIQYVDLEKKYQTLLEENAKLKKDLERITDQNTVKNKEIFGRKSENMDSLVGTADNPGEDPLDENASDPDKNQGKDAGKGSGTDEKGRTLPFRMPRSGGNNSGEKGHGGKNRSWIENLPCDLHFELDVDALDAKYGKYGWHIAFWTEYDTVEKVPSLYYRKKVCVPVISETMGLSMYRPPYNGKLLPGSYVSPSLLSGFMYDRQGLSLPYYRQAVEASRKGLPISRQTIIGWVNRFTLELFIHVYNHMITYLIRSTYTQCDETTAEVIHDGRKAGSKSYMWVHVTSEHYTGHPVVIFSFELTRGTDHLRHFYQDFIGYITCDAYISYQVLESENPGSITVTGCMMHCRRMFAIAFFVQNVSSMTDEQVMDLPETKILMIFAEIYAAEKPLKCLSADERLAARQETVKPLVDKLYSAIEAMDQDDNIYSDCMNKAVRYALNQKEHLCRFLDDGNIPIDDGFTERTLRGYCCARKSSMFYTSTDGAEASAVIYSLVETGKLNHADPQLYLQYLLERMNRHTENPGTEFLDQMMPWSEEYRIYEKAKKQEFLNWLSPLFHEPEKPKAPRKRDNLHLETAPPSRKPPGGSELPSVV